MDVAKNRRENLLRLFNDRFGGKITALAEAIGRSDAHTWQLLKSGKRGIGERMARHVETKLGLQRGTLDLTPTRDGPKPAAVAAQQPLALYSIEPDVQSRLLATFDRLTTSQQVEVLQHIDSLAHTNEAIMRELGGKVAYASDDKVGKHLPPVPRTPDTPSSPRSQPRGTHASKRPSDD